MISDFTRLQLERMGESVLEKAQSLREAVTFRQDMLGKIPEGTRFYHPLPRDRLYPTNPTFLDELPLNGWDGQSANGYWTRIAILGNHELCGNPIPTLTIKLIFNSVRHGSQVTDILLLVSC